MKKSLAYSSLTDTVFYVDGNGKSQELPKGNFIQMVLLWLNEGNLPEIGSEFERTLLVSGEKQWSITCKRLK